MATWQNTLDLALVRRLLRPVRRPGLVRTHATAAMLARHTGMAAEGPLVRIVRRYAGTVLDTQAAPPPIVYARPMERPPDANEDPSRSLPDLRDPQTSPRPVVPATPLPLTHPTPRPPTVTPAPPTESQTTVVQRKVAQPASFRPGLPRQRPQGTPAGGSPGTSPATSAGAWALTTAQALTPTRSAPDGAGKSNVSALAPVGADRSALRPGAQRRLPVVNPTRAGSEPPPTSVRASRARPDAVTELLSPASGPQLVVLVPPRFNGGQPPRTIWPVPPRHALESASATGLPVVRERIARDRARAALPLAPAAPLASAAATAARHPGDRFVADEPPAPRPAQSLVAAHRSFAPPGGSGTDAQHPPPVNIDVDYIVDRVHRRFLSRLAIESERRTVR